MNYLTDLYNYFRPQEQTYFNIAKTYYTSIFNYYIIDERLMSSLPIIISIIVIISLGNIYNISKNLLFIIVRIIVAMSIYFICIKLFFLLNIG